MKIKLTADIFVQGDAHEAGDVVEVDKDTAAYLIKNNQGTKDLTDKPATGGTSPALDDSRTSTNVADDNEPGKPEEDQLTGEPEEKEGFFGR